MVQNHEHKVIYLLMCLLWVGVAASIIISTYASALASPEHNITLSSILDQANMTVECTQWATEEVLAWNITCVSSPSLEWNASEHQLVYEYHSYSYISVDASRCPWGEVERNRTATTMVVNTDCLSYNLRPMTQFEKSNREFAIKFLRWCDE